MLIINADDFGMSHDVNMAISEAFDKNYINNTTIMVNMPGFKEAVELSKREGFFEKIGLHFNLFEGEPLTDEMKAEPFFYNKNTGCLESKAFLHDISKRYWFFLPSHTRKAIRAEAAAQIKKYKEAGFTEMHCDSHGHSHTFLSVYLAIRKELKKNGFKTMRISLNLYTHKMSKLKKIYKWLINKIISTDFTTSDFFSNLEDYEKLQGDAEKIYELMVHPVYGEDGGVINRGYTHGFTPVPELLKTTKYIDMVELKRKGNR